MNELTTEIIAALAQKQDLDEVFRHHLEIAINQLLQTELAEFLGYERYSYAGINTGNNRNGSYERSFDTKYGQLNLTIPRDRNGRFENHTFLRGFTEFVLLTSRSVYCWRYRQEFSDYENGVI